jgi:superfamily II DNA or RNA helicase
VNKDDIQEEALKKIKNYKRCSVGISMGVGKTLIGLYDMLNYPTGQFLVIAPKKSIFDTWKAEAHRLGLEHLLDRITFSTYVSLDKNSLDYTKFYLDECHSMTVKNAIFLNKYDGSILGLTGTPPRMGDKKRMVDSFCPVVYEYIVDTAIMDAILNNYKIYVHYIKLDAAKNIPIKMKNGKTFYVSEYDNYKYSCQRIYDATTPADMKFTRIMRMKNLQSYKSKEVYAKSLFNSIQDKCLIFANTTEQADSLCSYSYHSKNSSSEENLEMFKSGQINKLSCVLQLNEGVNVPDLKQSIILHSYGNERKFAQRLGRTLRLPVNQVAIVHVLCYVDTVDEEWLNKALSDFDEDKIIKLDHEYINIK